ncbi:MAG: universal stress protein [Candidatus Thiodiazotropha sp. (ex Myrtea sp. 'scaly one' KF741663)]|nr:universal stress protein [Candidatus Thiodiazotropha sp. (ex Myrtea sp. 'scaly one' KF741663)]
MADYQHILITVDFSSETDYVIDKALELATAQNAKTSFIHVVEYTGYLYPPDTPLPVDLDLEAQFVERARTNLVSVTESKGVPGAAQYVEVGSPALEIVRIAQQHAADLIVIGSHGRHGLQRILGSTASGVLHASSCDVLAVRVGACKT